MQNLALSALAGSRQVITCIKLADLKCGMLNLVAVLSAPKNFCYISFNDNQVAKLTLGYALSLQTV